MKLFPYFCKKLFMPEEKVILVDTKDKAIGLMNKMEAHEKAVLHRAFSVFIFNGQGELLLQQRAAHKYHSPTLWTNTVCSHQRQGESNIEAGKRRLQEEMGMQAELSEVFHFIYKAELDQGLTEHELDHVMIGFTNSKPQINPDEVMGYHWDKLENIEADIKSNPDKYTEWFKIIFDHSLHKLQEKLVKKMLQIPLEFTPVFKEKPWGGQKLENILHKEIPSNKTGESWEISDVKDNISTVKSGYFKGKSLQYLLHQFKQDLVGKDVYDKFGNDFPLLIKYIDAKDDLSIQVHPDDEMAQKYHNAFGKNELWHIVQADKDAALYIGLKPGTGESDYVQALQAGNLEKYLNKIKVQAGDTYYIPAGTVHAIGKNVLLAEVQQTSDITYRIYDWNRTGLDGKPRRLHTEKALEAINFSAQADKRNEKNIKTPYFQIIKQDIQNSQSILLDEIDGFTILMNTGDGEFIINGIDFNKGKTLLISAQTSQIDVKMIKSGCLLQIIAP